MSDDSKRRRGRPSRYLNGGTNALMRGPNKPGDEIVGEYTRERLIKMDARFCAAMERASSGGGPRCARR